MYEKKTWRNKPVLGKNSPEHGVCTVIANEVKQSSEGVCSWIASGFAFAMTAFRLLRRKA
jgi:hypothetical protein